MTYGSEAIQSDEITEYRSFLSMQEGIFSRTLAFDCGYCYTQEDCHK